MRPRQGDREQSLLPDARARQVHRLDAFERQAALRVKRLLIHCLLRNSVPGEKFSSCLALLKVRRESCDSMMSVGIPAAGGVYKALTLRISGPRAGPREWERVPPTHRQQYDGSKPEVD